MRTFPPYKSSSHSLLKFLMKPKVKCFFSAVVQRLSPSRLLLKTVLMKHFKLIEQIILFFFPCNTEGTSYTVTSLSGVSSTCVVAL